MHWIFSHCSGISPKPLYCRSLYAHCALCLLLSFVALPEAYLFSWALKQACPYFCPNYFLFAAAHYKELCSLCWKCGRCGRILGPWELCDRAGLCQVLCVLYRAGQALHQLQQNVPFRASHRIMLCLVLSTASSQESCITEPSETPCLPYPKNSK